MILVDAGINWKTNVNTRINVNVLQTSVLSLKCYPGENTFWSFMRQAVDNVNATGKFKKKSYYNLTNNCQSFAGAYCGF